MQISCDHAVTTVPNKQEKYHRYWPCC